jgi:hypothetical protein
MSVNPFKLTLFKRPNQIYYIGYYRDGRRCWKSSGARTKPEALKALTEFGSLTQDKPNRPSLDQSVERFMAYSGVSHSPQAPYKQKQHPKWTKIRSSKPHARNTKLVSLQPQQVGGGSPFLIPLAD